MNLRPTPYRSPVFLIAGMLLATAATAADKQLPPAESFFQAQQTSDVHLSPKGGYVSMLSAVPGGGQLLAVRDTLDPAKASAVVKTTDQEVVTDVHWINENRIGFTIKNLRIEFEGNLDEFAADRDGGNRVHLISGSWNHTQENTGSHIKDRTLQADYGYYDTAHDGSDDILVEKFSWNSIDKTPTHSRLYRLNTRTRELKGTFEGTQPDASKYWFTDGNDVPRVVTSQLKGRCITSYRKADAAAWSEIDNGACYKDSKFTPWAFDGADTLYVQANYHGYLALFRYDLKTMAMSKEPFVSLPGFDFNGIPERDWGTKKLLGIHLQTDAGTTVWLDAGMKALQAKVDAALPGATNTIHCAQDCQNAPVLLVASNSDRQPTMYILYTRASGKLLGLGSAHPDIQPAQMGMRDFYRYAARDGRQIPAYVTMPPGNPGKQAAGPQPAVVLVHGGPSVRGGYWNWDGEAQFLASRGYVVIQPEYRGSTGFGGNHFRAGWKQWGGSMQDDLADAAQWAVKQGWADPKRIAIMGASYGGYATLMGLIKNPDIFRCGVEWAGVSDINLMFNTPESDASEDVLNYDLRMLIGDPDKDAEQFKRNSPLLRAAELKQPLLMAHGLEDKRVPIVHAKAFRDAVQASNKQVSYIVYTNEAHGWRHEDNRIAFWKRVDAFLAENLKP